MVAPRVGLDMSRIMPLFKKILSLALAGTWFFATAIGTFFAPFVTATEANGYISVWALFFLSIYLVCHSFDLNTESNANRANSMASSLANKFQFSAGMLFTLVVLVFASLVEMSVASISYFQLTVAASSSFIVFFPLCLRGHCRHRLPHGYDRDLCGAILLA